MSKKSIIKTLYIAPKYENISGFMKTVRDDMLYIVIGDENGNREIKIIDKPKYSFYKLKSHIKPDYARISIDRDKVDKVTVRYLTRYNEMVKSINKIDEYRQAKIDWRTKRNWIQENIHNNPSLYQTDLDIEDLYKMEFNSVHGEHIHEMPINVSFSDIEVRADLGEWNQHVADVPICSVNHIDSKTETVYSVNLRDPNIPEIAEVENNIGEFHSDLVKHFQNVRLDAMEKIKSRGGDPNSVHSFKFNFKFFFVDTEEELISKYFSIIKETSPDFVGFWNINFDMLTFINRAAKLNMNMADLVSDDSLEPKYRYFNYIEDRGRNRPKDDTPFHRYFDVIHSSSITQWYDHMSLFSNLRRRFQEKNYTLGDIGEKYGFMSKVDLKSMGYDIKTVIKENYKIFLTYAIQDPIVDFMIEYYNHDMERYLVNCTDIRFSHGFKKTHAIKSEFRKYLMNVKNRVIGNNVTYDIEEKVPGAIIAKPQLIDVPGVNVMGVPTMVYKDVVDLDITAAYPYTSVVYNALKSTICFRIVDIFINKETDDGYKYEMTISDGGEFNRMVETIDTSIFDIGTKYFGLPTIEDIINDIENIK